MAKEEIEIDPRSPVLDFEGRNYPRFSVGLPIEYCRTNTSQYHPGHTVNLSEGGWMVALPEQIAIGEKLKIKLFFSSGPDLNIIETVVQVVWADIQVMEDGYFRFGLNFVDISLEDMKRLKSFIDLYTNLRTPPEFSAAVGGCLSSHNSSPPAPLKPLAKIKSPFNFFSFILRLFH